MRKVPYGKKQALVQSGKKQARFRLQSLRVRKDGANGVLSVESFRSVPDQMQPGNLLRGQRRACGFVAYQAREVAEFKAGFAHHGRRADPCGHRRMSARIGRRFRFVLSALRASGDRAGLTASFRNAGTAARGEYSPSKGACNASSGWA